MIEVFNEEFSFSSPLRSTVFISWENKAHKAQGVQISSEGLLVSSEAYLPRDANLDIMFPLIRYPDFSNLSEDEVFQMELRRNIHFSNFHRDTIRCCGKLVRQNEDKFVNFYSFKFLKVDRESELLVSEYLSQFTHNLVHLVDIITNPKLRKLLHPISHFLGYDTSFETELAKVIINDFEKLKT